MKRRKNICIICLLAIAAFGCIAYAAKIYEITYTSNIKTGSVDIKIEQYEVTDDGEKLIDPGEVMPNQDVSYIPRVTNLRAAGYVRVKVDIVMDEEIPQPICLDYIYGQNEEWIRIGDYFYCTKVLETGESSDIFEGFNVPYQWTQETASGFTINLTADVVQADNFVPNFDSALPWGSIEIEKAKVEDNISYSTVKETGSSPSWTYTSASGFETTTSDLFANFDYFMAGDTYKDNLEMKNEASNDIKVYFKTENETSDLLKKVRLRVYCDGKTVYEGNLASENMNEYFYLTTIKSGNAKDLAFEVILPEDAQNYYSVLEENVIWKFKVSEIQKSVQTGDESNILPFIAVGIIALLIAAFALITRRKDKENDNN